MNHKSLVSGDEGKAVADYETRNASRKCKRSDESKRKNTKD